MSSDNRIPPQATEVESAVLGSCLIEDEAAMITFEMLEPTDFYLEKHRMVYQALLRNFDKGLNLDLLSIETTLRDEGNLDSCGGTHYLSELTRSVSSAANVDYHCQILKEKTLRRNIIEAAHRSMNMAYNETEDTYDVAEFADKQIVEAVNSGFASGNTKESPQVISDAMEQILKNHESQDGITGIPTGLDLDNLTAGWQKSNFIVIAARPSMGKTAFTLHCLKQASKQGNVALLSLETSYRSIGSRLIISEAGIDGQKARRGRLSEEELNRAHEAASRLKDLGIIVDDTTNLSATSLRTKGKSLKKKYDIQMMAIDFIQLMVSDKDVREQQVAEISRTCKLLCKELDIPVLGLSQLNRGCENRHGMSKRPQLSDLRESGAIEQDADVVLSLFRPDYYGIDFYPDTEPQKWKGKSTENICEIIVNKQKDGPTGNVRQIFDKESMRFRNFSDELPWYKKITGNENTETPF